MKRLIPGYSEQFVERPHNFPLIFLLDERIDPGDDHALRDWVVGRQEGTQFRPQRFRSYCGLQSFGCIPEQAQGDIQILLEL
jgi:hypothetical protein